jgi:uncharacterized protein
MGLIRLIIFSLVIWMFWRLIRNYRANLDSKQRSGEKKKLPNGNMVACGYCKVHVPENTAIAHDDQWFCSESHRAKFIAEKH